MKRNNNNNFITTNYIIDFCEDEYFVYIDDCISNFEYAYKWYANLIAFITKILNIVQNENILDLKNTITTDINKIKKMHKTLCHLYTSPVSRYNNINMIVTKIHLMDFLEKCQGEEFINVYSELKKLDIKKNKINNVIIKNYLKISGYYIENYSIFTCFQNIIIFYKNLLNSIKEIEKKNNKNLENLKIILNSDYTDLNQINQNIRNLYC